MHSNTKHFEVKVDRHDAIKGKVHSSSSKLTKCWLPPYLLIRQTTPADTTDCNSVVVRSPFVACGRVPQQCAGVPAFTSPSPAYVTSLCGLPRPVITTKSSQFTHRLVQIRVRCAATIVVAARSLVSLHRRLNAHHHQHTLKIRKAPKLTALVAAHRFLLTQKHPSGSHRRDGGIVIQTERYAVRAPQEERLAARRIQQLSGTVPKHGQGT